MTMPVFTLLTPVALPQGGIGGQSALTDYSEGQQQSYSEDLAALLTGMETTLSQLDSEMQQLSEATAAELLDQGQVQSLSQSLVPAPLLVEFDAMLVNTTTLPSLMTSDLSSAQAEGSAEWLPLSLSALSSSAGAVSSQNPLPTAGLLQSQQSSALVAPLIMPGLLPQQSASDAAAIQAVLPQDLTESQDLWSALKPLQQNSQNAAVSAGLFNFSQNGLLNANQSCCRFGCWCCGVCFTCLASRSYTCSKSALRPTPATDACRQSRSATGFKREQSHDPARPSFIRQYRIVSAAGRGSPDSTDAQQQYAITRCDGARSGVIKSQLATKIRR
jgi:hypothetical protein